MEDLLKILEQIKGSTKDCLFLCLIRDISLVQKGTMGIKDYIKDIWCGIISFVQSFTDDACYYWVLVWCGIASYLQPLAGDIYSLLVVFSLNFVAGLAAGLLCQEESFSLHKFKKGILTDIALFFVLMSAIYFCGKQKGQTDEALYGISFISYSCFYFYGVNIFKNLNRLFPQNRVIAFLYYVLSFEFTKKIPGLERFLKKEEEAKKNHINNK